MVRGRLGERGLYICVRLMCMCNKEMSWKTLLRRLHYRVIRTYKVRKITYKGGLILYDEVLMEYSEIWSITCNHIVTIVEESGLRFKRMTGCHYVLFTHIIETMRGEFKPGYTNE